MRAETATRPRGRIPNPGLVVSGPGHLACPEFPNVSGDDQHHRRTTGNDCLMEVVVRSFPVMNRCRFDGSTISCPPDNQVLRRPVNLMYRVQIVVLQMRLIHLEHWQHIYFPVIEQFDSERPGHGRFNTTVPEMPAHQFPMDRHC